MRWRAVIVRSCVKDFDDRVDVVPVSNPNSFSQAQRISLAQSQLQMAMQAPQIHDLHEAYRRMYEALGVNDVDKILIAPSSEDPIPKDPAQENIDTMDSVQLKAFEGQDHDAHIMAHLTFGTSPMLQALPQSAISLQKHIIEHVKIKSQELATAQLLQQTGGQALTPDLELQLESMVAQMNAQEFAKLKQLTAQITGQNQGPDPLVQLKQQELQLDAQNSSLILRWIGLSCSWINSVWPISRRNSSNGLLVKSDKHKLELMPPWNVNC